MGARVKLFVTAVYCFSLLFSWSQDDTSKTLTEIPIYFNDSIAHLSVMESAVPLYELNQLRIQELGEVDLGSALKYVPGIQLKDYGGVGGLKTIAYRSLGAAHTGITMDGIFIPQSQTGCIDLSSFELFGLQKIQFSTGQPAINALPGASSFLYANLIGIRSELAEGGTEFRGKGYANISSISNYEYGLQLISPLIRHRASIGLQGSLRHGMGNYQFRYPYSGSDSILRRENANLFSYKVRSVFTYKWTKSKLELSGSYYENNQELPGAVILYNPYNDQKLWTKQIQGAGTYLLFLKGASLKLNSFWQSNFTRYLDPTYLNAQGYIQSNFLQMNLGGGAMLNFKLSSPQNTLFVGSDVIRSELSGNEINANPIRIQNNSVLGFGKWFFNESLKLESNLSFQLILDQYASADSLLQKRYDKPSPFIALSYLPFKTEKLRLRTFYRSTFRMPSFNDLYYNLIGNLSLKPEEAQLYNMGLTYQKSCRKMSLEFTGDFYYNSVKNKIIAIPTKDIFIWSMQNIGEAAIYGMDLSALWVLKINCSQFSIGTNHNFNRSQDITDPASTSFKDQLPYIPFYTGNYSASWTYKKFTLSSNLVHSGKRYSLNQNISANYLSPYVDWNLAVSKTFEFEKENSLSIKIQGMNLLNNNYEVIRSFPMPGRYYRFILNYSI